MTWRERVVRALQAIEFTEADRTAAVTWATCAVGEHHAQYPDVVRYQPVPDDVRTSFSYRGGPEMPADLALRRLGGQFYDAVEHGWLRDAESLLDMIEARVQTLKREYVA